MSRTEHYKKTWLMAPLMMAHLTWAASAPQAQPHFKCPVDPAQAPAAPKNANSIVTENSPFKGSKIFRPKGNGKHLSVVLLHGSEGGSAHLRDDEAKALAAKGYNVLVLCYFDCNRSIGQPEQTLVNVNSNIVLNAVKWMRHRPYNDGKVVVDGWSRGGELTLIAGSMRDGADEKPDALIAHSPSDKFVQPFNWEWQSPRCWTCKTSHCTQNSPDSAFKWNPMCGESIDPDKLNMKRGAFLVNGVSYPVGTRIPIENFHGPIQITVADKDEMWPVDQTKRVQATLTSNHDPHEVFYFPGAQHLFSGSEEVCRRALTVNFLTRVDNNTAGTVELASGDLATR